VTKAVAAASSTLTYAVVGLVGIIVSWLILSFIQNFTGANVTEFKIPS
jgi:putative flippase GtrA